jgi:hypothetical protein
MDTKFKPIRIRVNRLPKELGFDLSISSTVVTAATRKLKTQWTVDAVQDLKCIGNISHPIMANHINLKNIDFESLYGKLPKSGRLNESQMKDRIGKILKCNWVDADEVYKMLVDMGIFKVRI